MTSISSENGPAWNNEAVDNKILGDTRERASDENGSCHVLIILQGNDTTRKQLLPNCVQATRAAHSTGSEQSWPGLVVYRCRR